jgi:hypothetical protein
VEIRIALQIAQLPSVSNSRLLRKKQVAVTESLEEEGRFLAEGQLHVL